MTAPEPSVPPAEAGGVKDPGVHEEYRVDFEITAPGSGGLALLRRVEERTFDWMAELTAAHPAPAPPEPLPEPQIESGELGDAGYSGFRLEAPHLEAPEFRLAVAVNLATAGGPAAPVTMELQSRFLDDGRIPPPELLPGPPRLALDLLAEFECRRGPGRLSAAALRVTAATAPQFAAELLLNPQRRLPLIIVAPDAQGQAPVNPDWLQARLAGLALVAAYDAGAASELMQRVDPSLRCYDGAVRLCRPEPDAAGHPLSRNPLWMPDRMRELARRLPPRALLHEFRQHFAAPEPPRLINAVRQQIQQQRLIAEAVQQVAGPLRSQLREREEQIELLHRQRQTPAPESDERRAALRQLNQQLREFDQEIEELRRRLDDALRQAEGDSAAIVNLHQQQLDRDQSIERLRQNLEEIIANAGVTVAEIDPLHRRVLEIDQQIEPLRQQLDNAAQQRAMAEKEVAETHQRLRELDRSIEESRQALEDVGASPVAGRLAYEKLSEHVAERGKEDGRLRALISKAMAGDAEIHSLIAEFNQGLQQRNADIENLNRLLGNIDSSLDTAEPISAELRGELEERAAELQQLQPLLAQSVQRQQDYQAVIRELQGEEAERGSEQADIASIINDARRRNETPRRPATPDQRAAGLLEELEAARQMIEDASANELAQQMAIQRLEAQLAEKDDETRRLRYELARRAAETAMTPPPGPELPAAVPSIASVAEAVRYAEMHFDRLRFLDSARDSAENYPYHDPQEVYDAFAILQDLAIARASGRPLGKSVETWLGDCGWAYSPRESETTMNEYGSHRRFPDGRKIVEMQEHLKLGGGTSNKQHYLRIYLRWDEAAGQQLIGHIGEHLPIASD